MTIKTRLVILSLFTLLFAVAAPYIVFYSLGYRIDFESWSMVATGGIYVRVQPAAVSVAIGPTARNQTGFFTNYAFFQNLLPGTHDVSITKEGYHDYKKTLSVKGKEVTKLENVVLFKKDIVFELLDENTASPFDEKVAQELFVLKNGVLRYSDTKENESLTKAQKDTPLIGNILAYLHTGNNIFWLGSDGFVYRSEIRSLPLIENQNAQPLNEEKITVLKNASYKLYVTSQHVIIKENAKAWLFDQEKKSFVAFSLAPVKELTFSPDGKKILYYNDHELFVWDPKQEEEAHALLGTFSETISDAQWMNNDYAVIITTKSIVFSEIDARGGVNKIAIEGDIRLFDGTTLALATPKVFFHRQEKRLYVTTQGKTLISEKLIP